MGRPQSRRWQGTFPAAQKPHLGSKSMMTWSAIFYLVLAVQQVIPLLSDANNSHLSAHILWVAFGAGLQCMIDFCWSRRAYSRACGQLVSAVWLCVWGLAGSSAVGVMGPRGQKACLDLLTCISGCQSTKAEVVWLTDNWAQDSPNVTSVICCGPEQATGPFQAESGGGRCLSFMGEAGKHHGRFLIYGRGF